MSLVMMRVWHLNRTFFSIPCKCRKEISNTIIQTLPSLWTLMMLYYLLGLRPFLVNELELQYLFHDRRKVYECLERFGIPVPRYACIHREVPYQPLDYSVEEDDFVEVHVDHFWKPFVENHTVDADDNRIMIYYPSSAGSWGMKELFPRQNT